LVETYNQISAIYRSQPYVCRNLSKVIAIPNFFITFLNWPPPLPQKKNVRMHVTLITKHCRNPYMNLYFLSGPVCCELDYVHGVLRIRTIFIEKLVGLLLCTYGFHYYCK
jgi:hypothetical protein